MPSGKSKWWMCLAVWWLCPVPVWASSWAEAPLAAQATSPPHVPADQDAQVGLFYRGVPRLAATRLKGKQLEMGEKRSITSRDKFAISKWCCMAGRVCGRCSQLSVNENHFIFCYLNMSSPPTQNNMRAFPGRTDWEAAAVWTQTAFLPSSPLFLLHLFLNSSLFPLMTWGRQSPTYGLNANLPSPWNACFPRLLSINLLLPLAQCILFLVGKSLPLLETSCSHNCGQPAVGAPWSSVSDHS